MRRLTAGSAATRLPSSLSFVRPAAAASFLAAAAPSLLCSKKVRNRGAAGFLGAGLGGGLEAVFLTGTFLAGAFLATGFLVVVFFEGVFLGAGFLAGTFLATGFGDVFLAGVFLVIGFLATGFLTGAFLAVVFFFVVFLGVDLGVGFLAADFFVVAGFLERALPLDDADFVPAFLALFPLVFAVLGMIRVGQKNRKLFTASKLGRIAEKSKLGKIARVGPAVNRDVRPILRWVCPQSTVFTLATRWRCLSQVVSVRPLCQGPGTVHTGARGASRV